ncbi:MAG: deoxyribodipyrimidine photo-lyase, partial [Bacteroidota bacterium]
MTQTISIFWYRRDLRLEDNVGLYHALNGGFSVLPIFIFDNNILDKLDNKSDRRVDFIHSALEKMNVKVNSFDSSIRVFHSSPKKAFEELVGEFSIDCVYANQDYEPYAISRDNEIEKFLGAKGIKFKTFKDQVILEKSEVTKADGKPYTVFTPYSKVWKQRIT